MRPLHYATVAVIASVMLLVSTRVRPQLVYNASASVRIGWYRIGAADFRVGDLVLVHLPRSATALADSRGYLPEDVPALKQVAAAERDRVCMRGTLLTINSRVAAFRLLKDAKGRRLPFWHGCRTLRRGEIFLLNRERRSFDGRYFGITSARDVIGRAVPWWHL